eukprot:TRINITY_DN3788_c0_g1_i1.p1 TRINITY_DN3788_c0_g1~~TRINITY_DN3788_c0_g1_i1.p1  ORF type:complete len:291 (-),score=61.28 TRINITY_DN3788_c0_g1_i1:47-823(-)
MPSGARMSFLEPSRFFTPEQLKLFEEVHLTTSDNVRIMGWLFRQADAKRCPTVLFLHSNAGNLSHRLMNIRNMYHALHVNVFILSYRGYGKSDGHPTEAGLQRDAQAALSYLEANPDIDASRIILFGRSLGGGVASWLASHCNNPGVKAVVLENTFTSIPDMIEVVMPWLRHVKALCNNVWNSRQHISSVHIPILFLSGALDPLVPPSQMRQLYDAATSSSKKEFIVFPDAAHMDCEDQPNYYDHMAKFLDNALGNWR